MSARALSSVGRLLRPVHRVRPNISNAGPSSYRQYASETKSIAKLYDRKGKLPQALFAESPIPSLVTSTLRRRRRQQGDWSALLLKQDTITRSFHATARRDALPLLPAGVAILKVSENSPPVHGCSDAVVYIHPHTDHRHLSRAHLVLSHRHNRRVSNATWSKVALLGDTETRSKRRGRGVLEDVVRGRKR